MADVPLEVIDVTTPYPNGEYGEPFKEAFEKVNRNFATTGGQLGRIDTVVAEVEGVKQEVVQMGEDLRAEVDGKIEQIDQQVTTALEDVDTKVNAAIVEIDGKVEQLEADIPVLVDSAIAGRIPGKNGFINGDFEWWQRGTTFNAAGYTADRWYFNAGGVASANVVRNPIAPGQFSNIKAPAFARVSYGAISDAAAHFVVYEQLIEGADTYAGQQVTVSFKVFNSGAAGRQIALELRQNFGSGGSATVSGIGSKKYTLAAGINTITHTVDVPSVAGKTFGANNSLGFAFWASAGTNWNARSDNLGAQTGDVHFTEVQIEVGGTATGFEQVAKAVSLLNCQRYYEKSFDVSAPPINNSQAEPKIPVHSSVGFLGGNAHVHVEFKVPKRIKPAVTLFSSSANNSTSGQPSVFLNNAWTLAGSSQVDGSAVGQNYFNAFFGTSGIAVAGAYICSFHWSADAEL